MKIGRVAGTVVSTIAAPVFEGRKLLLCDAISRLCRGCDHDIEIGILVSPTLNQFWQQVDLAHADGVKPDSFSA